MSTPQNNTQSHHQLSRPEFEDFIQRINTTVDAETLAKDLLGNMTLNTAMSNSEQLRFGTKGSLCINLKGSREGTWMNYESGKGGNLIQLVQNEKGLDFKSALSYVTPYVRSREVVQQIDNFTKGKAAKELIDWDAVLKDELNGKESESKNLPKLEKIDQDIQKLEQKINDVNSENEASLKSWAQDIKDASRAEDETGQPQNILQSSPPGQGFIDIYREEISELEQERDLLIEKEKSPNDIEKERPAEKELSQKVESAKEIISKTVPLDGTLAEHYLREERSLKGELPESLRYLPPGTKFHYGDKDRSIRDGALAAIATDSDGNQKAVQVTYLTKEGKRAETPEGDKFPKISYGSLKGACVELQTGHKNEPVTIAEGIETALSLKEAGVKGDIICSLGTSNMKTLDLQNRDVVIAGDWDGSVDKPSWEATEKAQVALAKKGNKVEIILPVKNPEQRPELTNVKVDFNDLLKQGGVKSVIDRVSDRFPEVIGKALSPKETIRDITSEGSHGKQKDTQLNKNKSPVTRDGLATHNTTATGPILEKMEPKITSEKGGLSQVTLPKLSPFKTNPFDMRNCAKNDLGRGR